MPATYDSITTTTLGSSTSAITLSGISSAYTDLRLVIIGTGSQTFFCGFNSDTNANYWWTSLRGDGTSITSQADTAQTSGITIGTQDGVNGNVSAFILDLFSYRGSTSKTLLSQAISDRNGSTAGYVNNVVGLWRNTSAVTSWNLTTNGTFNAGTTVSLYGILRA